MRPSGLAHRVLVIDDNAAIHEDYRKILTAVDDLKLVPG